MPAGKHERNATPHVLAWPHRVIPARTVARVVRDNKEKAEGTARWLPIGYLPPQQLVGMTGFEPAATHATRSTGAVTDTIQRSSSPVGDVPASTRTLARSRAGDSSQHLLRPGGTSSPEAPGAGPPDAADRLPARSSRLVDDLHRTCAESHVVARDLRRGKLPRRSL